MKLYLVLGIYVGRVGVVKTKQMTDPLGVERLPTNWFILLWVFKELFARHAARMCHWLSPDRLPLIHFTSRARTHSFPAD